MYREQLLQRIASELVKERKGIDELLDFSPLSIAENQLEAINKSKELLAAGNHAAAYETIKAGAKTDKKLRRKWNKQKSIGYENLIERKVAIDFELRDIHNELYFIDFKKRKQ